MCPHKAYVKTATAQAARVFQEHCCDVCEGITVQDYQVRQLAWLDRAEPISYAQQLSSRLVGRI